MGIQDGGNAKTECKQTGKLCFKVGNGKINIATKSNVNLNVIHDENSRECAWKQLFLGEKGEG